MQSTIFREYDIRGDTNSEFDISQAYPLAQAIITYFLGQKPQLKRVVVGMDGRETSPAIKDAVVQALIDYGCDVLFIGICPSPVLYFALYQFSFDAGLMITASHNPKEYNGIKILLGTKTIWGHEIKKIGKIYFDKNFAPLTSKKGSLKEHSLTEDYVTWLYDHFPSLIGFSTSFIVDSGNGTGGVVLPALAKKMKWKQVQLFCVEVDGSYPHHEADPTVAKNMQEVKDALSKTSAAFGVGLDGDCDRMAAMTKSGFLIPGDQLLALFAQDIVKKNPGTAVVFDVKASLGLIELLQSWKAKPIMTPCGHAIIKEKMDEEHALIGGELSCHFFFNDRHFGYDDGIYAMMRLLEIIDKQQKSLDDLIKIFPKKWSSPEIRIECPENKKQEVIDYLKEIFIQRNYEVITIDGIRVNVPHGWINIRASNTQPVLSIRLESDSAEHLTASKQHLIQLLANYFDRSLLERKIMSM